MTSKNIQIEKHGALAILRVDRAPANAIDLALANEFENALASIEDGGDVGALVLTGAGSCFSAGLDLKVVPTYDSSEQQAMVMQVNRLFGRLYGLPLPTIAAVNGHAIAGGLILTLACDYRVAAEGDYKLGLAEMRVGVPYPVAAMAIVQSELTKPVARRMVLTARNSNPREALASDILDELTAVDNLLSRSLEVAEELATLPRSIYGRVKRQLRAAALSRIEDAVANGEEPMLETWLNVETRIASEEALRRPTD